MESWKRCKKKHKQQRNKRKQIEIRKRDKDNKREINETDKVESKKDK